MSVAPPTTIAANLRWFAVVYALALTLVAVGVTVAATYGVTIPTTGLSLGVFVGVVTAAGHRFATRRKFAWASQDRNRLALGYVALSFVTSLALLGVLISIDPAIGGEVVDLVRQTPAIMIGAIIFAALVFYGLARLMLRFIANRGERHGR